MEFMDKFALSTSDLVIKDHTNNPSGLTLTLQSLASEDCRKVQREIYNEGLELEKSDFTIERTEANNMRLYGAAIVGWKFAHGTTLNGDADPALTTENKNKILKISKIFQQIDAHLAKEKNFLPK